MFRVTVRLEEDLNIFIKSNNSEYREATPAVKYRDKLVERYGEKGETVLFAEAYEVSEYGSPLTDEIMKKVFTF